MTLLSSEADVPPILDCTAGPTARPRRHTRRATGVVMVVYLHEALDRRLRRGGAITADDVWEVTVAGAVLRLRPMLMTVSAS